ncbi:MAG TPA: S1 RNA-binding domain-containing protein [Burkholderiaceae bacterium]
MGKEKEARPTGRSLDEFKVGDVHLGQISGVATYGVFVNIGKASGLCHRSNIPKTIDLAQLPKKTMVKVSVREIKADNKLSLDLLDIVVQYGEKYGPTLRNAANIGANLQYGRGIDQALTDGASKINGLGLQYQKNHVGSLTGIVAEGDHPATFNVDAAFQKSKLHAERVNSYAPKSPDMNISDQRGGNILKEVSSKIHPTAEITASKQRGYGNQDRLCPKDQVEKVRKIAKRQAASERMKPRDARQQVASEHEQVAKLATDHLKEGNVKSTARTREESQKLAEKARSGKVTGQDIVGGMGERALQGAKSGGITGAAVGAAVSAVTGTIKAVNEVRSGGKTISEASLDVSIEVAKGTIDGGVKGATAGAATAAAKVLAQRTASQGMKRMLGGSAPAAVAITTCEVAKHAIDFARGTKTAEQFRAASVESAKGGATSFIGAEIGFCIGGPVGAIIGGIAAPIIVEEAGLFIRLDRMFTANTATGHHGGALFHMEQIRHVLAALRASEATIFLDRVLTSGNGFHNSAEIVMAHQGKVYAIDFKAWLGMVAYHKVIETKTVVEKGFFWDSTREIQVTTGEIDQRRVDKLKEDDYGYWHLMTAKNPVNTLNKFSHAMKDRLIAIDARWKRTPIERIVVLPDVGLQLSGELASDPHFIRQTAFLNLLVDDASAATPQWMLDSLSTIPTWDALQDCEGNLYQGLIETKEFTMRVKDGLVTIPFDAVLKIDVAHGGALSRSDNVKVTLRNLESMSGTVEKQEIVLRRKSHSKTYLLQNLSLVCPANSLFGS